MGNMKILGPPNDNLKVPQKRDTKGLITRGHRLCRIERLPPQQRTTWTHLIIFFTSSVCNLADNTVHPACLTHTCIIFSRGQGKIPQLLTENQTVENVDQSSFLFFSFLVGNEERNRTTLFFSNEANMTRDIIGFYFGVFCLSLRVAVESVQHDASTCGRACDDSAAFHSFMQSKRKQCVLVLDYLFLFLNGIFLFEHWQETLSRLLFRNRRQSHIFLVLSHVGYPCE